MRGLNMNSRMSKSGIDKFYIFHFKYRVTINLIYCKCFWINRVPMEQLSYAFHQLLVMQLLGKFQT